MTTTNKLVLASGATIASLYLLQRFAGHQFADAIADGDHDRAEAVASGAFELAQVGAVLTLLLIAGAAVSGSVSSASGAPG
jgi:4-hydroxybenzoate polyprenyltransferase